MTHAIAHPFKPMVGRGHRRMTAGHLPPEPMIGGLLRLLSESMRSHILQRVATFGYTDIVPAHLAVFQVSSPDGTTPSELAGRAFMTKQAMNYLLGELEERGYLQRLPAEGDGRSRVVVLSRRGHRLEHAMTRAVTEVEVEWERLLGKSRFAQMRGALMDLPVGPPSREGVRMGGLSIGHIHLKVSDRHRRFDR